MQIGRATDRSGRRGRRGRRGGGDPRRRLRRSQDRRSAGWPTSRRKPTGSSRRGSRDVVGRRERPPPPRWDLPRPRPGGVRQRLDVRLRRRHWPRPTPTSRLSRGPGLSGPGDRRLDCRRPDHRRRALHRRVTHRARLGTPCTRGVLLRRSPRSWLVAGGGER